MSKDSNNRDKKCLNGKKKKMLKLYKKLEKQFPLLEQKHFHNSSRNHGEVS